MPSEAFVVPFERGVTGRQTLMDTGQDGLFLWYSSTESWNRDPVEVAVHKHDDVDEAIVMLDGEGFYLHGPTPGEVVRTPWRGPCLLWMPAGDYHRIVVTSPGTHEALLLYTAAGSRLDTFATTIARAVAGGSVPFADLPIEPRERAPTLMT
jgi:hypothetical protein